MYSTVIKLKANITSFISEKLHSTIETAFSNRAGTIVNSSTEPYHYEFTGDNKDYACLEVGLLTLKRDKLFISNVDTWKWIDDNPDEFGDVLEIFSAPVK